MDQGKIKVLKNLLLMKYGSEAASVARARAEMHSHIDDHEAAAMWSAVAGTIRLRHAQPDGARSQRPVDHEPTLDEVLHGSVTKAVLDANNVDVEELRKALLRDARRRRRRLRR
jgi:hypothetical protein